MSTYDILINSLTNGDTYNVTNEDGSVYTVQRAPNKYMLQAARAIKQLLSIQATDHILLANLTQTNAALQEEINVLRTQNSIRQEDPPPQPDGG